MIYAHIVIKRPGLEKILSIIFNEALGVFILTILNNARDKCLVVSVIYLEYIIQKHH